MELDTYALITIFSTAFPDMTCKECREAMKRLQEAGYVLFGVDKEYPQTVIS